MARVMFAQLGAAPLIMSLLYGVSLSFVSSARFNCEMLCTYAYERWARTDRGPKKNRRESVCSTGLQHGVGRGPPYLASTARD